MFRHLRVDLLRLLQVCQRILIVVVAVSLAVHEANMIVEVLSGVHVSELELVG